MLSLNPDLNYSAPYNRKVVKSIVISLNSDND